MRCMWVRSCETQSEGSGSEEGVRNSPGRPRVVPYTISDISSFSAVRMPRSTSGRASILDVGLVWASRAAGDESARPCHWLGDDRR